MARLISVYAALLLWVALAVAQYDYNNLLKGCYEGRSDDFTFGGLARTQPQRERCAGVCSKRGQKFVAFGTINCFCAESEPPSTNKVDMSRCESYGLDGWNTPKLTDADGIEEVFVVFNIDPKRKNDDSQSVPQNEATSSTQSALPTALSTSAGRSRPIGCFPGLPLNVDLNKITITEDERRECAKSCGEEGKAAVIFSGLKCGCTDILPDHSTRVEDIRCAIQFTNKLYRTDLVYSVWTSGAGVNMVGYKPKLNDHPYKPSETSINLPEPDERPRHACFRNPPSPKDRRYKVLHPNTPGTCHRFCKKHNKRYMFLQASDCRCSDEYPGEMEELNGDQCDIKCWPDNLSQCGGQSSYSVYSLGAQAKPVRLPKKQIGQCFSSRALSSRRVMGISDRGDFREKCLDRCKDLGKPIAMMHDNNCWCATTYPHYTYSSDLESCYHPCQGDDESHCGGTKGSTLYYSLYATGVTQGVPRDPRGRSFDIPKRRETTWHGCWNDPPLTEHRSHRSQTNTVKSCVSYCRSYKSTVAAVRGKSCVCAESYPEHSRRRPDSSCKSACPGHLYDDCGGPQAWTVVNTGLVMHVPYDNSRRKEQTDNRNKLETGSNKAALLGCYDTESVTPGAVQVHIGNGGAELCASRCKNMKKPVSALQDNRCVCRDSLPQKDSRVDRFHCNSACQDAETGSCGGKRTWSIYNSGLQVSIQTEANTKPTHGCFKFDRLLSTRITPQLLRVDMHGANRGRNGRSCAAYCAEEGYPVALRHSSQCFCSPGLPQERKRVEDELCSYQCRGEKLETCGGPSYAYTVYKTEAYMPDLHNEEKTKSRVKKPKEEDPSPSPDGRPQCLYPAMEKANEVLNVVAYKVAAVTREIQNGFFWVRDKAQHVFDICLWNVMVFFSNILYHLGFLSAEGVVEL